MTNVSYRNFTGIGAENYQRHFVPAIATFPSRPTCSPPPTCNRGKRVLDVACGTGVIARLAAECVGPTGTVTAIDLAADMIDVAKAMPALTEAPAIQWRVGDASSLPFADEQFDAVTCQMGLMFMEDRVAALAEMRRVLVPGGRVVVNTPGAIQTPFALMEQAIVEHISADLGGFVRAVFSMHDPEAVAAALRDAGLRDVDAHVSTATFQLAGPAEFLWQYINLTPMGPFVAQASEEAQAAMEQQVVKTWQPYVTNGVVPVDQPMVVASGRR